MINYEHLSRKLFSLNYIMVQCYNYRHYTHLTCSRHFDEYTLNATTIGETGTPLAGAKTETNKDKT